MVIEDVTSTLMLSSISIAEFTLYNYIVPCVSEFRALESWDSQKWLKNQHKSGNNSTILSNHRYCDKPFLISIDLVRLVVRGINICRRVVLLSMVKIWNARNEMNSMKEDAWAHPGNCVLLDNDAWHHNR